VHGDVRDEPEREVVNGAAMFGHRLRCASLRGMGKAPVVDPKRCAIDEEDGYLKLEGERQVQLHDSKSAQPRRVCQCDTL
jgi:hypothetical protein